MVDQSCDTQCRGVAPPRHATLPGGSVPAIGLKRRHRPRDSARFAPSLAFGSCSVGTTEGDLHELQREHGKDVTRVRRR